LRRRIERPAAAARQTGWTRPGPEFAVAVAYVAANLMAAVDMQIVNVALPTLSRTFSASLAGVQWTVIAYLLALAVLIPASSWIGDRIGVKQTFLVAMFLFTLASAVCGLVDSLGQLIAARALQGAGGGMLIPASTAMLYRTYPPERRARLTRTLIVPVLIGPAIAPILGGVLTQSISWRWVFLINVPIALRPPRSDHSTSAGSRSPASGSVHCSTRSAKVQRSAGPLCPYWPAASPGSSCSPGSRAVRWAKLRRFCAYDCCWRTACFAA
jgi:MFS family permease